jgi:hypothetical protein
MSLFARASWPGDHRDEIVAGALVAAVIVVLGYASGIGAPAATSLDSAAPPTAGAPPTSPGPSAGSASGDSGTGTGGQGGGSPGGVRAGDGAGDEDGGMPVVSVTSSGTSSGRGHGSPGGDTGHGHIPEPSASASDSPPPVPSPTPSESCGSGEVRLVQPLLNAVLTPVTGLLDGLVAMKDDRATASPSLPAVCVGVAVTPSASVTPEVLP